MLPPVKAKAFGTSATSTPPGLMVTTGAAMPEAPMPSVPWLLTMSGPMLAPAATDVMLQLPWAPTVTGMPLATVPATLKVAAAAPPPTLTAVLLLIEPLPVSVRVPALTVVRPP